MSRQSLPPEKPSRLLTRARRWLIPAALLALMPKCILCMLAWTGLGAALGFRSVELCGAGNEPHAHWIVWTVVITAGLAVAWFARPVCHLLGDKRVFGMGSKRVCSR